MLDNTTYWELGMTCIVLIGYIVGKVWIHYKVDTNDTQTKKNKGGERNGQINKGKGNNKGSE
jgi:hypothetical protein